MRSLFVAPGRFLVAAVLLVFAGFSLRAQTNDGAIAGSVVDSSGGAITGAEIVATGVDTHSVYNTVSSSTGAYRFTNLALGTYNLTVTAKGFKVAQFTGVVVQINSTVSLDVTMQPGDVKETLTVIADAPTVQTETSDIGTVVDKRQIQDLPLAVNATGQSHLRSPEAFVFLTPGTVGPGTADSGSGVFQAKLAGGQNFGNEVILDGASTARSDSGSSFDQTAPSVEALQEFKITTSTVPAEFGRTTGGVESFTTKSGTNSYHGSAFDIFRNDDLNANEWFNNFRGAHRDIDKKNDYGGSWGGPVWIPKVYNGHDKTFFFFSWEQYRQKQGATVPSTVPTDNERKGDFSSLVTTTALGTNPCDGSTIFQGQIFDPSTTRTVNGQQCRTAFPGNQVPINSTVAQNILALVPEPTTTDKNQYLNNFLFTTVNPILDTTYTVRVDENLTERHKIFFSFNKRDQESLNGNPALPFPVDSASFSHPFITDYYRAGWDYIIKPTVLNHLSVGLNRIYNNNVGGSANGTDWPAKLGISGAHGPIFPEISFNNGTQGLSSYGTAQFDANYVNALIVADSVSWARGRHSMRFGVDIRAYQYSIIDASGESPSLSFDASQTAVNPNLVAQAKVAGTGDPFASFLLGQVQGWGVRVRSTQPRFNSHYVAGYAEDDFKARKNLMLNLGLRYEVETPRSEAHGAQSVISLTTPNPGAIGPNGPLLGALIFGKDATGAKTYYKNFAPRVGFSYAPDNLFGLLGPTVLRGGYAIYYGPLTYGDFGQALTDGYTASPGKTSDFNPSILLDSGIPSYPPPPNLDPAQLNGGNGFGFGGPTYLAKSYGKPGMVQNWSLEVQRQLAPDLILSVGYVGTRATRLRSSLALVNNLNPQFFSLGTALSQDISTGGPLGVTAPFTGFSGTIGQALRPFPQYGPGPIDSDCCLENLGQSSYEAMLVKVERRFRSGLNLLASYTYSKTLTDADSALPTFAQFSGGSGGGFVQDSYNLKNEKSISYQDVPHTFVLSYIYELPVGKGKRFLNKSGITDKVLGGWQLGGVQRYQSGQPISYSCSGGQFSEFITGYNGCIRLSRVPGQPLLSPNHSSFDFAAASTGNFSTACHEDNNGNFTPLGGPAFFNCAAFFDPNATNLVAQRGYVFGNFPRISGEVRSQMFFNEDFSIIKRVSISERQSITLKGELINAFNRHVFGRYDAGPLDGGFGSVNFMTDQSRKVQFTLRYAF
ncbi:MAG TPA: TonB-dependent receptor [Candidatus Acidoferrum sp.]|nr:TonB-dependent receptor [Candidatus Acidoferrum sp.]